MKVLGLFLLFVHILKFLTSSTTYKNAAMPFCREAPMFCTQQNPISFPYALVAREAHHALHSKPEMPERLTYLEAQTQPRHTEET